MKKLMMILLLMCSMYISAAPKVTAVVVKMQEPEFISVAYDTTFTVLNNSMKVYAYDDHALVIENKPVKFNYRIRINKKWYRVSRKDFSIFYYGKRMNKKDLMYIKKFEE